ncbi:ABC transporter substrate-binding protein [Streptomycetaceae bacterium NBC_01309]
MGSRIRARLRRRTALLLAIAACATGVVACAGDDARPTVTVLGTWTGAEADAFARVVAPFERRTGIDVQYEGTRDVDAVLAARVEDGTPPDLAALSSPGNLIRYARAGRLASLDAVPGLAESDRDYAADWVTLGRVDGKRVAVVVKAALKSLLWYDPKTLSQHNLRPPATWSEMTSVAQELAEDGIRPWCIGLASSSASGWPGTDWIEDIMLARYGPDAYDRWVEGDLEWTSAEVSGAWRTWGDLLALGSGGPMGALLTPYDRAGADLVAAEPGCGLEHQASFAAGWYAAAPGGPAPGVDYDFVPFPAFTPPGTSGAGAAAPPREVAGDVMAMFDDTPAARELIAYLAGTEAQTLWVREGSLSANRGVPPNAYPAHPVAQRLGKALADAEAIRFDASDRMPGPMRGAFHRAVLAYVANPADLDAILRDLDQARVAAYP